MASDKHQTGPQTVLVSFFRFPSNKRIWAMRQMAVVPSRLRKVAGPSFFKVLGTGGGFGYSFKPDFRTYALLTVWDSLSDAEDFESVSPVMNPYRSRALEVYSLFLYPIRTRGRWSGVNPFLPVTETGESKKKGIVVLTRATLKFRFAIQFWKRVSGVSRAHEELSAVVFTKGVGEFPWMTQATFSVWNSIEQMEEFAHGEGGKHQEAVATTRRLNGFREELYARFRLIRTRGTWRGSDPVVSAGLIP